VKRKKSKTKWKIKTRCRIKTQ